MRLNNMKQRRRRRTRILGYTEVLIKFMECYQPGNKLVKDVTGYVLADSRSIWNRLKKNICQFLNVRKISDVRETAIHKAEPLIHMHSVFEVGTVTDNLKTWKLQSLIVSK